MEQAGLRRLLASPVPVVPLMCGGSVLLFGGLLCKCSNATPGIHGGCSARTASKTHSEVDTEAVLQIEVA